MDTEYPFWDPFVGRRDDIPIYMHGSKRFI